MLPAAPVEWRNKTKCGRKETIFNRFLRLASAETQTFLAACLSTRNNIAYNSQIYSIVYKQFDLLIFSFSTVVVISLSDYVLLLFNFNATCVVVQSELWNYCDTTIIEISSDLRFNNLNLIVHNLMIMNQSRGQWLHCLCLSWVPSSFHFIEAAAKGALSVAYNWTKTRHDIVDRIGISIPLSFIELTELPSVSANVSVSKRRKRVKSVRVIVANHGLTDKRSNALIWQRRRWGWCKSLLNDGKTRVTTAQVFSIPIQYYWTSVVIN